MKALVYTCMYLWYQSIHWYKFEDNEVERNLSCTYTVLCYMYKLENIYICLTNGSFSDNFNFSMKKASRAYNFCFISKRHVVFNWQTVGHIKSKLNAQRYKKDWNKFIFWLFKCLKFLPSRFTFLVTHSLTCIILPLSNIIICFKLSYPWKQSTE